MGFSIFFPRATWHRRSDPFEREKILFDGLCQRFGLQCTDGDLRHGSPRTIVVEDENHSLGVLTATSLVSAHGHDVETMSFQSAASSTDLQRDTLVVVADLGTNCRLLGPLKRGSIRWSADKMKGNEVPVYPLVQAPQEP